MGVSHLLPPTLVHTSSPLGILLLTLHLHSSFSSHRPCHHAHNDEADENGDGSLFKRCLTLNEEVVPAVNDIHVPPGRRLPGGWFLNAGVLPIPPIHTCDDLNDMIEARRCSLSLQQQEDPDYVAQVEMLLVQFTQTLNPNGWDRCT